MLFLHVYNLLKAVIQQIVTANLHNIVVWMFVLQICWFEEVSANEVGLSILPLHFVLLLQHDSFIMGTKYPVVAA